MNEGVALMLKRMESNPEEFEERWDNTQYEDCTPNRWGSIIHYVRSRAESIANRCPVHDVDTPVRTEQLPFLTDEEVLAIYTKYVAIQGSAFTHGVMRILLEATPQHLGPTVVMSSPGRPLGRGASSFSPTVWTTCDSSDVIVSEQEEG